MVFFVAKAHQDFTNLSLKLVKVLHNSLSHLKPMSHFIQMPPSILEPSGFVRNLPPSETDKKPYNVIK